MLAHYWFAFDIGAYEDSTAHLTMLQDGAYNRLIRHYYKTQKPIPIDEQQIVRISGAHSEEEITAVYCVLREFFLQQNDGWHNKRADMELVKARKISKLRREQGRRGGLAKAKANATAKAIANDQAKSYTVTVTDTDTKEESKPKAASAFVLPDWIPSTDWQEFEAMRRKARKPMTDRARALVVGELFKLRQRGYDPSAVLNQSIRNSWQDVYELRGEHGTDRQVTQQQRQPSTQVVRAVSNIAAGARIFGRSNQDSRGNGSAEVGSPDVSTGAGSPARSAGHNATVVDGEILRHSRGAGV